uniref:Mitochondrial carrier protein n=1 Tax=Zooxanthella nutricula TaxID=1333877 RepID=A0A6U6JSJ1_9DINO|mmetsp:Transcript_24901/g.74813  ORF Transcript_24901/g.74813 Transcript_24901/m.74813 type:complete len:319 (+) Transcript_24901:46-1002(+)
MGPQPHRQSDAWRNAKNFACGGVAGMVARTIIAPIERVKIIFQTKAASGGGAAVGQGWGTLIARVVEDGGGGLRGVVAFWKGNSVAVVRVFPYLGVQLASNDYYKQVLARVAGGASGGSPIVSGEVQRFLAGGGAGMTAVATTYPLDLARARMALLLEQGALKVPSMWGTLKHVYAQEGSLLALYSGAGVSMTGAAIYCGLKFATYDISKAFCRKHFLPDTEGPPSSLHRAVSGGLAGVFAQTFVYPFDVLRRRLQTGGAEAKKKYPGSASGLWRLYKDEGFVRGLYRGCSLNYMKTVPNTTVYLALFDYLKDCFEWA